jgi:hypothetical protein
MGKSAGMLPEVVSAVTSECALREPSQQPA